MAKQLMLYEKVVPVTRARHAGWSVEHDRAGFGFASESVSAPLMSVEFMAAATSFPIVFGKTEIDYMPMVLLGVETGRCLYVDEGGAWTGDYIPAFLRRYPFAFSVSADGATYTLCIDEAHAGCDPSGAKGERLYQENGEPAAPLQRALEFTRSFEVEHRRTREFGRMLAEQELLEEMNAEMVMPGGEKRTVTGMHIVSRERLKKLEGDTLAEFFRRDALELIYCHLASLRNLERLRQRAAG